MPEAGRYELPRLLLCEGPEDVGFFHELIRQRGIQPFHISHTGIGRHDSGGNSKFYEKLRALRLNRSFRAVERLLIVTDSDDDNNAAFAAVSAQIGAAGYAVPAAPWEVAQGTPSVALITIPDGAPGNLECYLTDAARTGGEVKAAFVDEFAKQVCVENDWTGPRKGKLWLRALVAARWPRDPGINLSPMFRHNLARRIIPTEHHSFNDLANYLADF